MKQLKKIIKNHLPLLIMLFAGAFLRLYALEKRTSFGADQEELSFRAVELLSGDPVVLGLPTSVGKFAIGPFFTYLWTLYLFLFRGDPVAGSYLSITLGLVTIAAFYFAGEKLFDKRTGIFLAGIYTFSHAAYVWDISPWPPSAFYLAQILLTLGANIATKNPFGLILVALGFSIGFSSHVAIFISLLPVLLFWLIKRPKLADKKAILVSFLIVFVGILPNFVFDITHNFDNFKRFIGAASAPLSEAATLPTPDKIFRTLHMSSVEYFIPFVNKTHSLVVFLLVVAAGIVAFIRKRSYILLLLLLSIFSPPLVFFFWKGNFSEYYLTLTTVPAFIFLVGFLFHKFYEKGKSLVFVVIIILFLYNIDAWAKRVRPLNLEAMKKAVLFIVENGGREDYSVSMTTEPGYHFGYNYLFHYYGASPDIPPKKGETKIFTIVIPPGYYGVQAKVEYDGIGVLWEGVEVD